LDNYGAVFDWWTHALISDMTFEGLNSTCDFFNIGPLTSDPEACNQFQQTASNEMGNIDIYDIYANVCLTSAHPGRQLLTHLAAANSKLSVFAKAATVGYAPCVDTYLTNYLNTPTVKQAIHALPTIKWIGCSSVVDYSYLDLLRSMLPVYQSLLTSGIKILVYSGDVDGIVPITGTRFWLEQLNLEITEAWRPWIDSAGQVGGYTVGYKGLSFLSIRNAGHLVPGTQPTRALDFFSRFLTNTSF
jgi:serine carboxypeptidase-like clade 2